jgi:hypothetical protein
MPLSSPGCNTVDPRTTGGSERGGSDEYTKEHPAALAGHLLYGDGPPGLRGAERRGRGAGWGGRARRQRTSIAYEVPNVQLDANGTTNATANFSIRGLAVNDSIPSDQPAVGVFVDGVYMGVSAGVLRGPQGVLFGRNVTGGAVVINTREPSDTFSADAHVRVEQAELHSGWLGHRPGHSRKARLQAGRLRQRRSRLVQESV